MELSRTLIEAGGIEVRIARLDRPPAPRAQLLAWLAPDERVRADRFRHEADRLRFAIGRWSIRALAGPHLGVPADAIRLVAGAHDKPMLAAGHAERLHFNIAHSGDVVVVAFARRDVGIDVEADRPLADRDELARRFFSAAEVRALDALGEPERTPAFLRCWTRKEALLKAWGTGIAGGLDRFDVPLAADGGPWTLDIAMPEVAGPWTLAPLQLDRGYSGAVAWRGGPAALRALALHD
jgi:4'-phosphopantetheinyl transferase